ncbi:hypothetical protein R1flu_014630 [Riccia fluitans]|uniref:Amidohydrolase-related domain-containing protein n=1 Tax=Riccia fluitans TaxID=41844 RepID=A0ABD1YGM5_9MARC
MLSGQRTNRLPSLLCVLTLNVLVNVDLLGAHRIDLHTHIIPPFYLDWLKQQGYDYGSPPSWNASSHLAFMESTGILTSVVSITTPGVGPFTSTSDTQENDARLMARKLNEFCAFELAGMYPGKFKFWATMTLPDVNGSIAEAHYALKTLKAAGVILESNKVGLYLGDPAFDSFFKTLDELRAVVFVHPTYMRKLDALPGLQQNVLDFTHDLTRAAVNLVFTNTTQKYPHITFIFANAAGALPFVAYRAALSSKYYSASVMLDEFQKFFYETSFSTSPSAMPTLLEFASADRLVFGSDWPNGVSFGAAFYTQILDSYSMPDENRGKINSSNIEELWKRIRSF